MNRFTCPSVTDGPLSGNSGVSNQSPAASTSPSRTSVNSPERSISDSNDTIGNANLTDAQDCIHEKSDVIKESGSKPDVDENLSSTNDGSDDFKGGIKSSKKSSAISTQSLSPEEYIYHIKWIRFRGKLTPIVTQNENGPCPLIAITNVLLLENDIALPENTEVVTGERLIAKLSDILLSKSVQDLDRGQLLNYETTVSDALNLFPSLQTGLDVNIRFTGVSSFEFTSVLGVFDLFGIALYHGWLLDPRELELASIVADRTYNQLVEQIIHLKASSNPEDVRKGLLADEFLEQTASQLTYHGLYELTDALEEGQLAVLFRNNHFCTIIKNQGRIYVLVTDMGLLNEPNIVWEALDDVDGNTQFTDAAFRLYTPPATNNDWESATSNTVAAPESTSSNQPGSKNDGPGTTKSFGANATSIVKSALLRTFTSNATASAGGSTLAKQNKFPSSEFSKGSTASEASKWERKLSVTELARACSKQLTMNTSSDKTMDSDLNLAARLQLEEIESTKPESRVVTVRSEDEAKCAEETTSHTSLSVYDLKEICSEEMLEQAKLELGSGSDFDLAMRLQFEELQQVQRSNQTNSCVPIGTQNASRTMPSSVESSRPATAAPPEQQRRYSSNNPDTNPPVTISANRPNDDGKSSCSLM